MLLVRQMLLTSAAVFHIRPALPLPGSPPAHSFNPIAAPRGQGGSHMGAIVEAVRIVEDEVRELIRRRGLDPLRQAGEVSRLVEAAVLDYDERALLAPLPPIGPLETARRFVFDAVAGFGALQPLLDDPAIEEIWLNAPNNS